MASSYKLRISPLAAFKPPSSSRAWVSIPNPNNIPLIATGTSEKTVRVYSLKNFTLHSTLEGGHERSVRSVAWKPVVKNNGNLCIATGSFDQQMGIWRRQDAIGIEESEEGIAVEGTDVGGGDKTEVEISSFGEAKTHRQIIDDEESEGDNEDWEFAIVLEGHDSEIKSVAYSPSGQYLASCSRDKSIWIWEEIGEDGEDDFETIAVLQEHTADVKSICWRKDDGDGEMLASSSYDETIRLWRGDDEGEWSCVGVLEGHEGIVWSLDWEPEVSQKAFAASDPSPKSDNEYFRQTSRLVSCSSDNTVRIWSKIPTPPPPNRPSYFNTGIPSTMRPGPVEETWKCTAFLPAAHTLPIYSVNWSPLTGHIVSTGSDGRVIVYEEKTKGRTIVGGEIEREWVTIGVIEGAHGPYEINHATWCKRYDGGRIGEEEMIVTTGDDGNVKAWSIEDIDQESRIEEKVHSLSVS